MPKTKPRRFNARARRNELQAFWAKLVKTRDRWTCQQCGCRDRRKIQAAHIFGKKASPATRFHRNNGVALCVSCHFRADQMYRHQFTFFCQALLGDEKFQTLMAQANKSLGTWGPEAYDRDLKLLNDWAAELGVETL